MSDENKQESQGDSDKKSVLEKQEDLRCETQTLLGDNKNLLTENKSKQSKDLPRLQLVEQSEETEPVSECREALTIAPKL